MRTTEIDGKVYNIRSCEECPFRDMGGGWSAHCTHPYVGQGVDHIDLTFGGIIPGRCPLREVKEHKPCPFCGSTDLKEVYYDDEGDMLEEWMMEEANNDGCDYKSWQEYLDARGYVFCIDCMNCHGCVQTKVSIEDAWAKWNKRV